jgi:hypothetical protein
MNRSPTAFVADLNNLMQEYGVVIMYDTHGLYLADWLSSRIQQTRPTTSGSSLLETARWEPATPGWRARTATTPPR